MSDDVIYSTADAVAVLVQHGLLTQKQAANLGRLMTPNTDQHVANVEIVIRPLGVDYAAVESVLGFEAGSLDRFKAISTPAAVPQTSLNGVDPVKVKALMQELVESFNRFHAEISKGL